MQSAFFRPADRPLLNAGLLAATLVTIYSTYVFTFHGAAGTPIEPLLFTASLVAILGSHEMGHYVLARIHGVDASLPYFIPLPLLGVGTLGAVIRIRGRIPTRNALVDIGAAGPLAGLVVAIPLLFYGLRHSTVVEVPLSGHRYDLSLWALLQELWTFVVERAHGVHPSSSGVSGNLVSLYGDNLLMKALQFLALGPLGPGKEVEAHPMVLAGWFGLLVTMLNLIPIGQLDGGHVTYALFGKWARPVGMAMAFGLFVLMLFFSASWILWLLVSTKVVGFRHPPVIHPEAPLSTGRRVVGMLCLLALIICVIPIPVSLVAVP